MSTVGTHARLRMAAVSLCMVAWTLIIPCLCAAATASHGEGAWQGVDEAVVEKIAREHHREARPPLIDVGQGDLLLFVFLAAGAAGGFAAGYYWRKLTEQRGR